MCVARETWPLLLAFTVFAKGSVSSAKLGRKSLKYL
jgi:hypothetical protein